MSDQENLPLEGDLTPDESFDESSDITYRGSSNDPIFGLLLAGAVALGLAPIIGADGFDLRYVIVWGLLASFGVLAWLFGSGPRIVRDQPENLAWGIVFALILVVPLLGFGGNTFAEMADLMLRDMTPGTALAFLVFIMPMGETLYFRGIIQNIRPFWQTALMASTLQMVIFFPLVDRGPYPLIVGIVMVMANMIYGYVRQRNSLAGAWICQITVNIALIFFPFVSG